MKNLDVINNKYNINILNEIFLNDSMSIYIIEGTVDIYKQKLIPAINSLEKLGFSKPVATLNDLFSSINKNSQVCEVVGCDVYIEKIKSRIDSNDIESVYLPLIDGNKLSYFRLQFIKLKEKNISIFIFSVDIEAERSTEYLYQYTYKDNMTGLFNINACYKHLNQISDEESYIGFIDLDNFKYINDALGHFEGDKILTKIGARLKYLSDQSIMFYHRSGDEFIFLTHGLDKKEVEEKIKLIINYTKDFSINGITITGSCGYIKYDKELTSTADDMLLYSDIAMYMAKSTEKGSYKFLSKDEISNIKEKGAIETLEELRKMR